MSNTEQESDLEALYEQALQEHEASGRSLRQVAINHAIPYTTLQHRANGGLGRSEGHKGQHLLTKEQEQVLVEWC